MKKFFPLTLAVLLAAGCVTSNRLVTGKARPPIPAAAVELKTAAPAGAEEIGIVTAVSAGQSNTALQNAVDALKRRAGEMGANVIVILGTDLTKTSDGGLNRGNTFRLRSTIIEW